MGLKNNMDSVPEADTLTGHRIQATWADEETPLSSMKRSSTWQSDLPVELDEQQNYPQVQRPSAGLSVPQELSIRGVSRKRSIAPEEEDRANENFDVMDHLPAAREVKRRKVAEQEERIRRGETIEESLPEPASTPAPELVPKAPEGEKAEKPAPKGKGKRVQKGKEKTEDPYVVRAREIREREEEEARVAKEEELAAMDGLEVEKMRNLAIVEIMEVGPRADKPTRGKYGDEGDGWDDKWNGRKNFKKFKRQGGGGPMRTMRGTVMVNLVEHKGKDFGIGDSRLYPLLWIYGLLKHHRLLGG